MSLVLRSLLLVALVVTALGCDPVKMPHEMPGPIGCGMRDPRDTAPGMLSVAQQRTHKEQGDPDETRENDKGGKDWVYNRNRGSVFGEQATVELFRFDAQGLLYETKTDVLFKAGK